MELRKLSVKDYLDCFKSAHILMVSNLTSYVVFALSVATVFWLCTISSILLIVSPILVVIAYYTSNYLAVRNDSTDSNRYGIVQFFKSLKSYIVLSAIVISAIFALAGPYSNEIVGIVPGLAESYGIELSELKPLIIYPEKMICFLVFFSGVIFTICFGNQLSLLSYKYNASPSDAATMMFEAHEINNPLLIVFGSLMCLGVLFPSATFWMIAPYSIAAYSNINYFINKAIFEGNTKTNKKESYKPGIDWKKQVGNA